MTTETDNLKNRLATIGEARENSEGIAADGFIDASGEYPRQGYFFGNSINKSAKGETVHNLKSFGGDTAVETITTEQNPSQYPHSQVSETPAGHVWLVDDTPGGERVLIKHKSGSGIELRADGSVLFSSVDKKVEVTGDDHTVIVEGEGNLIYKGNLTVKVTGDYNLEVGGNINVTTAGNKTETINHNHIKNVDGNQNYVIKGSRGSQVVGTNTDTILGENNLLVKGEQKNFVEGNVEFTSGGSLVTTAALEWAASSQTTNISGMNISVMGAKGTIGGQLVDHYGKAFAGPPGGSGAGGTTFYGTLIGKAQEAITSDFANKAGWAKQADAAKSAPYGPSGSPGSYPTVMPFATIPTTAPMPSAALVIPHLSISNYAIRNVQIDTTIDDPNSLISKILKTDDYQDLFDRDPTIHEIRSKLRDPANLKNSKFTSNLVSEGKLSSQFSNTAPKNIGRVEGQYGNSKIGQQIIGNNPLDKKSKRFKIQ